MYFLLKTLLHFAAATKFPESNIIFHLLCKLKTSLVNIQNFKNQSPLHIAILIIMRMLFINYLHSGADPSLVDNEDNTPLHLSTIFNE